MSSRSLVWRVSEDCLSTLKEGGVASQLAGEIERQNDQLFRSDAEGLRRSP